MKLTTASLSLLLCCAVACAGGADSKTPDTGDNPTSADAAPTPTPTPTADAAPTPTPSGPDAAPYACGLPADLGALGTAGDVLGFVGPSEEGLPLVEIDLPLAGTAGAILILQLWEGYGAFADTTLANLTLPLTVQLVGDKTDLAACGACAFIIDTAGGAEELFPATSGSITLTALNPTAGTGSASGSIANVAFAHADAETLAPLNDGCATRIGAVSFSTTLVAPE